MLSCQGSYGCTFELLCWPICLQIWGIRAHLWSQTMSFCHGWDLCPSQHRTTFFIRIRHMPSVWAIVMLSQGHLGASICRYTSQVGPRFGKSGSLVEWKWCHNIMVEADIHLRPLHISIVAIYKVIEPLTCCSRAYGCTHIPLCQPSWPQIWEVRFTCGVKMMPLHHGEANIHLRPLHTSLCVCFGRRLRVNFC